MFHTATSRRCMRRTKTRQMRTCARVPMAVYAIGQSAALCITEADEPLHTARPIIGSTKTFREEKKVLVQLDQVGEWTGLSSSCVKCPNVRTQRTDAALPKGAQVSHAYTRLRFPS